MTPRLKFTALCLVACLFHFCANGQEIKDGFIILPDGKYQYGTIQFDPTLNMHEECLFTITASKPYTKFTPDQISGYGVINGIHFTTKDIVTGGSQKKHFLKKEIDALLKFYSFNSNRFFIEKDNLEELTESNYKALLTGAMKGCKNISSSIKKTRFDLPGIQNLFIKYQRCIDPESAIIPFTRFQFDILAGIEANTTTVRGAQAPLGLNDIPLTDKTLMSTGVNAIISFKKNKRLSFATGAYYYQQKFYMNVRSNGIGYFSTDKINFNYGELLIPITLQFSFFKKDKRVMPYVKAGYSIPITIKSKFIWENEKEYANSVIFERYNLPQKFKQSP